MSLFISHITGFPLYKSSEISLNSSSFNDDLIAEIAFSVGDTAAIFFLLLLVIGTLLWS